MTYSKKLLEELLSAKGWSNYKAAKELGVSPQYIGKVLKSQKNEQVSNEVARRIALLMEYDEQSVILRLNEDKSETPEERRIWGKLLMSSAAVVTIIATPANNLLSYCAQCIFIKMKPRHSCAL